MTPRPREALERELAHVHFLLAEVPHWDSSSVLKGARSYLTQRYERQARILLSLIAESSGAPAEAAASIPIPTGEASQPVVVAGLADSMSAPMLVSPGAFRVAEVNEVVRNAVAQEPTTAPLFVEAARVESSPGESSPGQEAAASFAETFNPETREPDEAREPEEALPLPPVVTEPLFEAPRVHTATARLVEEVSTWDTVWRPFLYESIGWFIGAFLIVAGSLYLAFDSWSGLTSFSRSLVVFGMTAGYASAFSICGALLARREALKGAGRILGLIGAAVAPFAGLALGPVDGLSLEGIPPWLLIPLLLGWAGGAAVLVRKPAESFDVPSRPLVQLALMGATLMMGLAPLLARLGAAAFWLDVLPCALFFVLARQHVPESRSSRALAFTLAAPLYLMLLYAVRLHLALGASGAPPALGSYAPFLAFLLITCLRLRPLPPEEAADALSVGIAALQVGCLVLAGTGSAPAFFLCAAIFTWSAFTLSRGEGLRVRWLYLTYAGAYLSYTSSSQLLPGVVQSLLDSLKAHLGIAASGQLPFNYAAASAVPFVLAGALLAGGLLSRSKRLDSELDGERAEILLRCTAIASSLFALLGHAGLDQRPGFWTALGLSAICVASGLRYERLYLCIVGSALTLLLPFSSLTLFEAAGASAVCGGLALAFAALAFPRTGPERTVFSCAVGWLAFLGLLFGLSGGDTVLALGGVALCGAAALLVTWRLEQPILFAVAACAAAAVVPKAASLIDPSWIPLALAVPAVGLAALGELQGRARYLGGSGVAYALLAVFWGAALQLPWLGIIVLLAAAAVAVTSRTFKQVRPLAIVLAGLALLPRVGAFSVWPWMTPTLSGGLFVLWSLGASVWAARVGRSASTFTAGLVALVYPLLVVGVASGPQTHPLMLGAALAALLTARVLHPSVSVLSASVWMFSFLVEVHAEAPLTLAVATGLSVLALLESHPGAFRVLAGERRFALVASLCALPFLLVACHKSGGLESLPFLLGAMVLPLVWTRANRQPAFAGLAPLFVLLLADQSHPVPAWSQALPLLALGVVRAAEHLPAARRLLLGRDDEETRRWLSAWMQGALTLVGLWLIPETLGHSAVFAPLVVCLVLLPGPLPSVRVGVGTLLLAPCFPLHPGAIVVLMGLGLLTHHVPARLWAFFRAPPDAVLRPVSVVGALVLASWTLVQTPTPERIVMLAGALGLGAFLLSLSWMLTASLVTLAAASLGRTAEHGFLEWRAETSLTFAVVALGAATLSALCQVGSIQRTLTRVSERLSPGLRGTWSEPLWSAGMLATVMTLLQHFMDHGPGGMPLSVAVLTGLASLVLMVTRERMLANVATALLAGVLVAVVPPAWSPAVVAGTGLVLCMAGTWLEGRGVTVGAALHYSGCALSLVSVLGLRHLGHPATGVCLVACLGSAWAVVYRRREYEQVGWVASLVVMHALLAHVGVRFSTGRGAEFILPLFGGCTALLATLALSIAGEPVRRRVGHLFAGLAMLEVLGGLLLVPGSAGVVAEAIGDCVCLAVLFFALVRRGVREQDEESAFLAQGTLVLGYLAVRLHALASGLGTADSLASLVGGVIFSGLYVFVQREGAGLSAFRRPALFGAFLFPMAGLLTAPWHQPLYMAALLVGYAAHFAALAAHPSQRGMGSLVSAVAFNAALACVWVGTGAGEPQYYVIPAGLSLLVLLRVFHDVLEPETRVKLRALAVTFVYVAGAWRPLLFADSRAMLLCVLLCVVGVAAGMALRIRSYVYLGSAFMVTCVVANLARFGIQDHRMGAAFLSLLGLGVVGFMVLFTAKRAELLSRYERVRAMMSTWEG